MENSLKKVVTTVLFSLLIITSVFVPVFADSAVDFGNSPYKYVDDGAGLLTSSEAADLGARLDKWCAENDFDIVILTRNGRNSFSMEFYANEYYDFKDGDRDYKYADNGIILFVDMSDRSYYTSCTGTARDWFENSGKSYDLEETWLPLLKNGEYYRTFLTFIEKVEKLCEENAEKENAKQSGWFSLLLYKLRHIPAAVFLFALVFALFAAFILTGREKSKLNSVRRVTEASKYVKPGSFKLLEARDVFLFRTVSKTRISSPSNAPHSGGRPSGGGFGGGGLSSGGSRGHSGHGGHF